MVAPSIFLLIFCCFISSLLSVQATYAQLQGTYTIGGPDGNYATFTEAAEALQAEGISAPVTFQVRAGTYTEQLILSEITGNSCEFPVVFEGETGFRPDVTLQAPPTEDNSYTIHLTGADGISFRNMSIYGNGTVVYIQEGSDCISLENNILASTNTNPIQAIVYAHSGSDNLSNNHTYINNQFKGGTVGLLKTKSETWEAEAVLDCVSNNGDGTYTAHFGYDNPNTITVSAGFVLHNRLLPALPEGDERPHTFQPGRHQRVFSVPFRGQWLEWRLMGQAVRARQSASLACRAENARIAAEQEINFNEAADELTIYPNFFSKEINIRIQQAAVSQLSFRIYSLSGTLLTKERAISQDPEAVRLDLQHLSQGAYILEVYSPENRKSFRIFKQ